MAARPRKTTERGVKRPTKAEREAAKALPESLIPTRRADLDGFTLPYERLAIHLGFEAHEFDGCGMDKLVAVYVVFAAMCAEQFLPPELVFRDLNDMGNRGELKGYMEEHAKRCPHNPSDH